MIISQSQVESVIKAQLEETKGHSSKVSLTKNPLETTVQEKILYKIKKAALKGTDLRKERIAMIKNSVRKGNYSMPSEDIADKMVNRSIVDEILKDEVLK